MCLITPKGSTLWPIVALLGAIVGLLVSFTGFTQAATSRGMRVGLRLALKNLRVSGFSVGDVGHADLKGEFQGLPVVVRLEFLSRRYSRSGAFNNCECDAVNIAKISMTNDCGSMLTLRITAASSGGISHYFDPVIEGPWTWAKGFKIQGAPEDEALRLLNSLSDEAFKLLETTAFRELSVDSGTCTAIFAQAGEIEAAEIRPWLDFCSLIAKRL